MVFRTDKGDGVEPVRTFCRQEKGVNFSQFCAHVFWTAPYFCHLSKKTMAFHKIATELFKDNWNVLITFFL